MEEVIEVVEFLLVFFRDHKKLAPQDYQRLMALIDAAKEKERGGNSDEPVEV